MTQYLVAIHHPDDYDPAIAEDEEMARDIDVLNEEMIAAGVRVFAGGLHPASSAKSLRAKPDGKVFITDGPYLETKEHIGGFWILEAADMDEALAWGARPSSPVGCRLRCARSTDDRLQVMQLPHCFFCGFASKKSFTIGTMTSMRCISVTCVVLGKMANLDSERGRMSP